MALKTPAGRLLPRIVRFRDAPGYVGMDRNRFNAEVRPYLTEVPIGRQGIGFDRLELDAWVDDYITRNGRPARKGRNTWDAKQRRASSCAKGSGTSTSTLPGGAFAKALEHVARKKQSDTSHE
ncbi:MAG: hypothetical protein V3V97_05320 [Hyphomicrobiaceae bacterium]